MKILIPTKLINNAKILLKNFGYEVIQDNVTPLENLIKQHSDVDAMIVRSEKITKEILINLPKLKLIVRAGAGFNTIDIEAARTQGIDVMNTPGANANAVAEEVIAMALAAKRYLIPADNSVRQGLWEKANFMGSELTAKTIGIAGFGNIGQLLAKRLSGFDTKILVFDPFISNDIVKSFDGELVSLEDLFSRSDVISLHMPANDKTNKIVNKSLFDLMKDNSILINCARYEIIDEEQLREAKKKKNIIYCNDVYPKDEAGDKAVKDIAEITLPHLGASTIEANTSAAVRAATQIIDYFEKAVSKFIVNRFIPEGLSPEYQKLASLIAKITYCYYGNDTMGISKLECSFYGDLAQYKDYLIPSILSGLSIHTAKGKKFDDIQEILQLKGIKFINREVDNKKNYGEAITIDLIRGKHEMSSVSIRGTIVENCFILSRINQFDKLYFDMEGHNIVFIYPDQTGIIAVISQELAEASINIEDLRSPTHTDAEKSIAIFKVNKIINEEILEKISKKIGAEKAFQVTL